MVLIAQHCRHTLGWALKAWRNAYHNSNCFGSCVKHTDEVLEQALSGDLWTTCGGPERALRRAKHVACTQMQACVLLQRFASLRIAMLISAVVSKIPMCHQQWLLLHNLVPVLLNNFVALRQATVDLTEATTTSWLRAKWHNMYTAAPIAAQVSSCSAICEHGRSQLRALPPDRCDKPSLSRLFRQSARGFGGAHGKRPVAGHAMAGGDDPNC